MARRSATRCERSNHLVQKDIGKPIQAMGVFNAQVTDGQIPIVLTPNDPMIMTFFMKIPSGLWVLKQKWNAHAGMLKPGLKVLWPSWYRVSHVVTKQAVTYSNPVRGCPTSDNVMVDIAISISFQIGPTEQDAYTFVYSLGAHRFDELLYSLTEEAIRGLVHSVRHDQVHDLREEFAVGMKTDLNTKLNDQRGSPPCVIAHFGGDDGFQDADGRQEKNQENQMRILLNQETQRLTALEKENERAIQDLEAECVRAAIIRDERRTEAEAKAQVKVAQHMSRNENKLNAAEGFRDNAVSSAMAKAAERKAVPSVELENLKSNYDRFVTAAKVKADAIIEAAEKEATKILASAEAEGKSAAFLETKRQYDYSQKEIQMEMALVEAVPLVVSGKNGDELIQRTFMKAVQPAS